MSLYLNAMKIMMPDDYQRPFCVTHYNERLSHSGRRQSIELVHRGEHLFVPEAVISRGQSVPSARMFTAGNRVITLAMADVDSLAPSGYDARWATGSRGNLGLLMKLHDIQQASQAQAEVHRARADTLTDELSELVRKVCQLARTRDVPMIAGLTHEDRQSRFDLYNAVTAIDTLVHDMPEVQTGLLRCGITKDELDRIGALRPLLLQSISQSAVDGALSLDSNGPLLIVRGIEHWDKSNLALVAQTVLLPSRAEEYQLVTLFAPPRRAKDNEPLPDPQTPAPPAPPAPPLRPQIRPPSQSTAGAAGAGTAPGATGGGSPGAVTRPGAPLEPSAGAPPAAATAPVILAAGTVLRTSTTADGRTYHEVVTADGHTTWSPVEPAAPAPTPTPQSPAARAPKKRRSPGR